MIFYKLCSKEHHGGFASCRTEIETGLLDGFSGLKLLVEFLEFFVEYFKIQKFRLKAMDENIPLW